MLLLAFLVSAATVEGITESQLPNGLRVLTLPDPSKPTITVNLTYLVGSRNEDYGETGMAHLLEHLLFKGTPKHPNIPKELSEKGARANATTYYDRTNYYETFPAGDDSLKWALALEADRMVNSFIAKKDLDSEMTVVRNEFEAGENSPQRVLQQRTFATAYLWHNYGKATIGARSDIEQVPIERLQAFYREHYQPDNAVLMIAGRFDEKKALGWVNETFGKLPKPTRSLQRTYTQEPTQDGERVVTLRRTGDVQALMLAYHVPAGAHEDFAAVDLLAGVLGSPPSGRLFKALVDTKKATRVSSFTMQLHDPGLIGFNIELRKEQSLEAAREAAIALIESFADKPPSAEEVEKARAEQMKQIEAIANASERLAIDLTEWIGMGDWRLFFIHRDRLAKVTPADVQRVAKAYLKSSNRTVGAFLPTEKPDRAEIPLVNGLPELLASYKGQDAAKAGEAFEASPAAIEARTKRSSKGGVKMALLPKRTRNEVVSLALNLRLGNEAALMDRDAPAAAIAPMLLRGTKKRTREQLKDALDKLKARVSMASTAMVFTLGLEVERKNLGATLALLQEVLREPAFDPKELDQWKQEQLASIEAQRSQPQALATLAFQRHMRPWPKGHPMYVMSLQESHAAISGLKPSEVRAFFDDFYGASSAELAVVGDFEEGSIQPFSDMLAGWKAKTAFARIADPYRKIPAKAQVITTPDKPNAFILAGTLLQLQDTDADYPALMVANYILGGGLLQSRLATRIRQKEGISYGVGSVLQASSFDKRGGFTLYAIYAPENGSRLEAAYQEELTRALVGGFTDEELASAKSGLFQARDLQRSQDGTLANMLATWLFVGRTFQYDAELEKKIGALDGKTVLAALRRHVDVAAMSSVKAGDFKAVSAAKASDSKESKRELGASQR